MNVQCQNFGDGFFGTTAITSAGSNGNGSLFEYDVPIWLLCIKYKKFKYLWIGYNMAYAAISKPEAYILILNFTQVMVVQVKYNWIRIFNQI